MFLQWEILFIICKDVNDITLEQHIKMCLDFCLPQADWWWSTIMERLGVFVVVFYPYLMWKHVKCLVFNINDRYSFKTIISLLFKVYKTSEHCRNAHQRVQIVKHSKEAPEEHKVGSCQSDRLMIVLMIISGNSAP